MLTVALINLLQGIVSTILAPLPTGSSLNLTSQATAVTTSPLWPNFGWLNNYIPIDQMIAALTIILTTLAITLTIRVALYLWNLLPFGGSN